jgi:hypothetical protein
MVHADPAGGLPIGTSPPEEAPMSNHFSAANLKYPGGDARLDLTDLFVFSRPAACGRTVLIIDASPFLAGPEFHPGAVYRINIDNDGDLHADAAFTFVFSPPAEGPQVMTAYYATGRLARQREPVGEVLAAAAPVGFDAGAQPVQAGPARLFAGVRSDPFFADAEGALHGFRWTGHDTFAGSNILSIALDVPDELLGPGPRIGVWATISLRRDGALVQMDRGGHPSINPIINPDDVKDRYNAGRPADDIADYLPLWSRILQRSGGYTAAEAVAAAGTMLPDILRYDRGRPAAYPNGRNLTDNVFDARMALLTNGTVSSDGLKPHDDLLAEFPYLGPPNP